MTNTTSATPYTFTITVLSGVPQTPGGTQPTETWQVDGAYVTVQDNVFSISDTNGNVVAMVQTFGTVVTRNDVTTITIA
jgi:hypothetical protein